MRTMYSVKRNLSFLVLLLLSTVLFAQPKKVVADKIAAVVGDRIILRSDIKNSVADMVRRGENLPPNAECMIMEQAVVSKVMMLQAEKDSLPVTDEDVESDLDNRIRSYCSIFHLSDATERR